MLKCKICGAEKPLDKFTKDKARARGYKDICKECRNKKDREKYAERKKNMV